MLTWTTLFASLVTQCRLSAQIVFHRKLLLMVLGIAAYYGVLYALAVFRPDEGFSAGQAPYVLVEIPGAVLAIYLAMDLVSGERDRRTLEALFSTSSSHYGIWTLRMVAVYLLLAATLLGMSAAAYFLFAEFPFALGGLNAFAPAFLIANLTFFFSVLCKSSNTAGMLSLGVLAAVLQSAAVIQGRSNIEAAAIQIGNARNAFLPSINASYGMSRSVSGPREGSFVDPATGEVTSTLGESTTSGSQSLGTSFSMNLYNRGNWTALASSKLGHKAAELDLSTSQQQVVL